MERKWDFIILQRLASKRKQNRDMEHVHVRFFGTYQKKRLRPFLQNELMNGLRIFCIHIFLTFRWKIKGQKLQIIIKANRLKFKNFIKHLKRNRIFIRIKQMEEKPSEIATVAETVLVSDQTEQDSGMDKEHEASLAEEYHP
jgi:hypothetical protein